MSGKLVGFIGNTFSLKSKRVIITLYNSLIHPDYQLSLSYRYQIMASVLHIFILNTNSIWLLIISQPPLHSSRASFHGLMFRFYETRILRCSTAIASPQDLSLSATVQVENSLLCVLTPQPSECVLLGVTGRWHRPISGLLVTIKAKW